MFLDVGNRQRIDDPTPEQIEHHLRNLPAEAAFVVLNADEEHFIQATPAGGSFRVEWRQEAQQRFALVPVDRAAQAFLAFHRWDEPALKSFPWRRLSLWNDPYLRVVMVAVVLVVIALISLWSFLR
jgi:hypothetical protein